jgi:energy-coupling factor transporter ATP-binding protein EcfA2
MKELFLLRGVPGAGKSTLAKSLGGMHIESDKYFMDGDEYKFDPSKLKDAHAWCQNAVRVWAKNSVEKIVVSNTFTQEWEIDYYFELAKEHGYRVYSLIVENRHGNKDVHNVPEEKLLQMKQRFEIKL